MADEITAEEIKRIRGKYGLSQKAFARVLGIGEASIARYESGQTPTRAMANLIRAADMPSFMLDCLERDGQRITPAQRESTQRIIYAEIAFDEKGFPAKMDDIYELTLQQEILNEKAAEMLGDLARMRREAEAEGNTDLAMMYESIANQIALAKHRVLDDENFSERGLAELNGRFDGLMHLALTEQAKAA